MLSTDRQTDGRTDGRTDEVIPIYPPFNFVEAGGIIRTIKTPTFWHTPHRLIPSQNKTKSKLQILKIAKNSNFEFLQETLHTTHLLKLLGKMYKYKMDPTKNAGTTGCGTDGWTDGRTDGRSETNIPAPPTTSLCRGYNYEAMNPMVAWQYAKQTFHNNQLIASLPQFRNDSMLNSSPPGLNGHHFGRQHFQMNFLEWKWYNSDLNFIEICSQEPSWQQANIGSGNGLVPNRRQAIIWTNADLIHWQI